jgi:hypothetical protein
MATTTVLSLSFAAQPPTATPAVTRGCGLHIAIIQLSVRRWERPWRHQRAIVLFADSPEETRLRIYAEGRIKAGEHVLQVIRVRRHPKCRSSSPA